MGITINAREYAVTQAQYDAAKGYLQSIEFPEAKFDEELGKMMAKAESAGKKNALAHREEHLAALAQTIMLDGEYMSHAMAVASEYAKASETSKGYRDSLGFIPTPKKSGNGYRGVLPLLDFDATSMIYRLGAGFDVRIAPKSDAPDGTTDPKYFEAQIELDLPDLDSTWVAFKTERQSALNAALGFLKDETNYKVAIGNDGKLLLQDAAAKSGTAEKKESSGTSIPKGTRMYWIAGSDAPIPGKRYEGTNLECFNAAKADGIKFAQSAVQASVQNGQVSKKLIASWGYLN